jgi:hypothetical protein
MRFCSAVGVVLLSAGSGLLAQSSPAVARMAENERQARIAGREHFSFLLQERSPRTGGHLWLEHVVEVDDGKVSRLLSVDGVPLSAAAAEVEQRRLVDLANDPAAFKKLNASAQGDEAHLISLLAALPSQFVLTPAGSVNGCTQYAFRPDPAYQPSGMEQKVLHVMEGTVSVKEPEDRLCDLQSKMTAPVTFAFGLLGKVNQGGSFQLQRRQVSPETWKSVHMVVHMDGKILLMKTLTRDQDAIRSEIKPVPQDMTLQQAVVFLRQ